MRSALGFCEICIGRMLGWQPSKFKPLLIAHQSVLFVLPETKELLWLRPDTLNNSRLAVEG